MFADRIIAHRGGAAHAPENTVAALEWAAKAEVKWVELDVSLLGDGTPVIIHDKTLNRTTNGTGSILRASWKDVSKLDAGRWFAPKFAGEPVPQLSHVLEAITRLGLGLNLELKTNAGEDLDLVRTVISSIGESSISPERILISSFNHNVLAHYRKHLPDAAIGLLYDAVSPDWQTTAEALNGTSIHANYRKLTKVIAGAIKEAGYDLYVYTPREPEDVDHQWAWGIDGLFVDDPILFLGAD